MGGKAVQNGIVILFEMGLLLKKPALLITKSIE
jgi:hypothetical protein